MDANGIVPDVIDEAPTSLITVTYGEKILKVGSELTPYEVEEEPKVSWEAEPDKYYLLCMVDPDAPTRKLSFLSEVNHWLVVNILGSDLTTGTVLVDYAGSGPPRCTGLHRYIFLVYEQPNGKIDFPESMKVPKNTLKGRIRFSIRDFARKYNLNQPRFGNYFVAQWNARPVDENNKSRCIIA